MATEIISYVAKQVCLAGPLSCQRKRLRQKPTCEAKKSTNDTSKLRLKREYEDSKQVRPYLINFNLLIISLTLYYG